MSSMTPDDPEEVRRRRLARLAGGAVVRVSRTYADTIRDMMA